MKKIIVSGVMLCLCVFAFNKDSNAQVRFNLNVNIGSQPTWGPVGYDHVEYYYLPDIEAYYYVPRHQFVYMSGGRWIFSTSLPPRYRNYDLYNGYKVVVNEPNAYRNFNRDRSRYSNYRGRHDQVIIRNSDEPKYYVVKGHPKYRKNDNRRGNGRNH